MCIDLWTDVGIRDGPTLGWIAFLRVQLRGRISLFRFRCWYTLPGEIWMLRNLIFEHLLDSLGFHDLRAGLGTLAVVE